MTVERAYIIGEFVFPYALFVLGIVILFSGGMFMTPVVSMALAASSYIVLAYQSAVQRDSIYVDLLEPFLLLLVAFVGSALVGNKDRAYKTNDEV